MSTNAAPSQASPDGDLIRLIFGKNVSMAISVFARLRIADLLADGPRSLPELASSAQTHPPSLYRVLRTLASVGIIADLADGNFALTPMGGYLRSGVKGSLRGLADMTCSDATWRPWTRMIESVRTGRTAFDGVHGEPIFEYLGKHPDESAVFNEAMTGFTSKIAPAVVEAYHFAAFKTIVDVGGGHGVLLSTILKANPEAKGILFDSPPVAAGAEDAIREAGLAGRCRAIGGDFFRDVPAGGDAYLMKHIIHDWSDDQATAILRNCRKGVNPGGRLLLIEMVVGLGDAADIAKLIDLEMLVNLTGRERTEAEYRHLLAGAGWQLTGVIPTDSPTQIIEAEPV